MTVQQREFQVGDDVRWEWTGERPDGKWFKARLTEKNPPGYPSGWEAEITDPGSLYAPDEWDRPVGYRVFVDEPSLTFVAVSE